MSEKEREISLKLSDLHLRLGRFSILNGVELEVPVGQTLGVIGPNGSGKTTMFNCISGFHFPTSGSVLFQGKDVSRIRAYQRARLGMGRLFQNFGIFREMTVEENMLTALESRKSLFKTFFPWSSATRAHREEVVSYLDQIGLLEKAKEKAGNLSGGQMRLLEIIRSAAFGAELFLLDEPTAGVSPRMKDDVTRLILSLRNQGKTIMIIEHDINFIQRFCDRIVVLDMGKIVMDGTPLEVRSDPKLQDIYFGTMEEANKGES